MGWYEPADVHQLTRDELTTQSRTTRAEASRAIYSDLQGKEPALIDVQHDKHAILFEVMNRSRRYRNRLGETTQPLAHSALPSSNCKTHLTT
jgi:hypothetical protein